MSHIFKASALWANAFYKSICPYACLSVCVFVCVFTFEVPFQRLFAPTSLSQMSKIVRDSESLGKSNGKKWSPIWKLFVITRVKLLREKSLFLGEFGAGYYTTRIRRLYNKDQEVTQQGPGGYIARIRTLSAGFFWYRCYYPHRMRDALSPVCRIFQIRHARPKCRKADVHFIPPWCVWRNSKEIFK